MKKLFITLFILSFLYLSSRADEGMWIPLLLEKYNIEEMQQMGFKLTAEDIYSINQNSLKDAVVIFGGGCTGEIISEEGLLLTNHHCGYRAIQSHSTVEHDYLTDGFWAMSKEQELPNPGLSATFLVRIEDVTSVILNGVKSNMKEDKREEIVRQNIEAKVEEATKGTHYTAVIRPFFYGNEFYMFVYETYFDVRLVGAPPSSIGKFGGDTDNWMWPRHTGDFSLFRIYADKNNNPAPYSPDNVPYQPKKVLTISLDGVEKGDFTMVMGYPGSTQQFLTSHAVDIIYSQRNPDRIAMRDIRLETMKKYMDNSDEIRIKYSSKYAGVSNSWKKWQGENRGLKRLKAIETKKDSEEKFMIWVQENKKRIKRYGSLMEDFASLYEDYKKYIEAYDYYRESVMAVELIRFASQFERFIESIDMGVKEDELLRLKSYLMSRAESFYKDYELKIDRDVFLNLFPFYEKNIDEEFIPEIYNEYIQKFGGINEDFADALFGESVFADSAFIYSFIMNAAVTEVQNVKNDPVYKIAKGFVGMNQQLIQPRLSEISDQLDSYYRIYSEGLMKMKSDKVFYPDANFTMRVAYGKIEGYEPRDAVDYDYFTTLSGVMEKDNPEIYDYDVPDKLKELYNSKDYGPYGVNGTMPVCFTASNHTSGGNSGSPVLNSEGYLIGINFDRNWEGTMSDIMYDPDQCRNISLDIRYVLFIIDKYAGAGYLVDEMTLSNNP